MCVARGRKPSENSKRIRCAFRLTDKTNSKIDYLCNKSGANKTEVFEEAINLLYDIHKRREKT